MTKKTNIAAENKARLATIAPAAFREGSTMAALAAALKIAFKSRSTGTWDSAKNKPVPSAFYLAAYEEYKAGSLATMLPQFGNMAEADAIKAARDVIADPKRSAAAKAALSAIRMRWMRALERAGIQTPRPKTEEAKANAAKAKAKAKAGNKVKAGQGETKPAQPSAFEQQAAKFMPPSEKTRESVIAYARLQLANIEREFEALNQKAAKAKDPARAIPSQIMGDIEDWRRIAKAWTF